MKGQHVDGGGVDGRKKRVREDAVSEPDEPDEPKRARVDSCANSCDSKSTLIHEDILDILDDVDNVAEADAAVQGLDLVIKSFEEEIVSLPQPDLLYLLEASDDELGLPPSFASSCEEQNAAGTADPSGFELGDNMGLENEIAGYEAFEFGAGGDTTSDGNSSDGDFLALGGLFDNGYGYGEAGAGCERVEIADPLRWAGSLPAR